MSYTFEVSSLEADLEVESDPDWPEYLQTINLTVEHASQTIAHLEGFIIDRENAKTDFHSVMDETSDELIRFSSVFFDDVGNLYPWFVSNSYHKGSGVWGQELNDGHIIYVTEIVVRPEYREQGVASWTLNQLLNSEYIDASDIVYCWPYPTDLRAHSKRKWMEVRDGLVDFFRKKGFRRLGRTRFFAYAVDIDHPSHKLAASDDAEEYWTPPLDPENDEIRQPSPIDFLNPHKKTRYQIQFPLHQAIKDAAAVNTFVRGAPRMDVHQVLSPKSDLFEMKDIATFIEDKAKADPNVIHATDGDGFTPLHIAASMGELDSLQALLKYPGIEGDLMNRDNVDGCTPLESADKGRVLDWGINGEEKKMRVEWLLRERMAVGDERNGWGADVGLLVVREGKLPFDEFVKKYKSY